MINSLLNQPRPQAPTQTRGSRRKQGTAQQIKAPGDEAGILPKIVSALFTTLNLGGGRQSLFMFNFVILAGMVSRVWSKIVAGQPRTQALCVVLWLAWPLRGPRGSI